MQVRVDANKCQGHTLCNRVAPELFRLREEDGHSEVISSEVPKALEEKARKAMQGCPEQAISIEE
ncbi:MAG TPA: ferredoxin [Candidatus Binataceae bacterium]|jgi:ferredoxin|nr:ferredoxin [Candidatus Binataceae bacterium]